MVGSSSVNLHTICPLLLVWRWTIDVDAVATTEANKQMTMIAHKFAWEKESEKKEKNKGNRRMGGEGASRYFRRV